MIKEGFQVKKIVVDGGLSCSNFTMKTQAAILGINLERNSFKEATVLGAALSAAFTAGIASIENMPGKRGGEVIFAERDDRLLCKYIKWLEKVE